MNRSSSMKNEYSRWHPFRESKDCDNASLFT